MKILTAFLPGLVAALGVAAAAPRTPAIDCAIPAAVQPFSGDPAVIWYDSFDDESVTYFEFSTNGGLFGYTEEAALGGAGKSLRGTFKEGTVSAGSLKVIFGDSPLSRTRVVRPGEKFQEVYWRVYVKHQKGWTGNPAKLSRATAMAGSNWSQGMIAHVWGGAGNQLTLDPASGIDLQGRLATTKYNDFANLRWLGNQPPAGYPVFATEESGKWVAVEAAARLNTPGESDGTFSLWIDGRLDTYRDGLDWRGAWDDFGINAVFLENYWNNGSPVEQSRFFDDFVISTSRIGLARTGPNPELIKTAFDSEQEDNQTGFQVQIAAPDGDIVWDSGTVGVAGDRVTVDATNGKFRGRLAGAEALVPATVYEARVRQRGAAGWSAWSPWRAVIETAAAEPAPEEPAEAPATRRRAPRR